MNLRDSQSKRDSLRIRKIIKKHERIRKNLREWKEFERIWKNQKDSWKIQWDTVGQ